MYGHSQNILLDLLSFRGSPTSITAGSTGTADALLSPSCLASKPKPSVSDGRTSVDQLSLTSECVSSPKTDRIIS